MVQGQLKLPEPIFEAISNRGRMDTGRTASASSGETGAQAIVEEKTRIATHTSAPTSITRHFLLLEGGPAGKMRRSHLLKMMLKATGEKGFRKAG